MVLDEALDDYAILGLKGGETEEEIRKKYKKLALRWHPDKNINDRENSEKKFKSITEAYSNLIREKSNNKNFGYDEDIQNFFNEHFEFESIKREEIKKFFNDYLKNSHYSSQKFDYATDYISRKDTDDKLKLEKNLFILCFFLFILIALTFFGQIHYYRKLRKKRKEKEFNMEEYIKIEDSYYILLIFSIIFLILLGIVSKIIVSWERN